MTNAHQSPPPDADSSWYEFNFADLTARLQPVDLEAVDPTFKALMDRHGRPVEPWPGSWRTKPKSGTLDWFDWKLADGSMLEYRRRKTMRREIDKRRERLLLVLFQRVLPELGFGSVRVAPPDGVVFRNARSNEGPSVEAGVYKCMDRDLLKLIIDRITVLLPLEPTSRAKSVLRRIRADLQALLPVLAQRALEAKQ
jgi:hypothetical protein